MLDPEQGQNLALPPDQELLSDLTAPRWSMTTQGIKVEPKEDVVERLGRSPDCADALVLSILVPTEYALDGPLILEKQAGLLVEEQVDVAMAFVRHTDADRFAFPDFAVAEGTAQSACP
jgi:hypothetical protein